MKWWIWHMILIFGLGFPATILLGRMLDITPYTWQGVVLALTVSCVTSYLLNRYVTHVSDE